MVSSGDYSWSSGVVVHMREVKSKPVKLTGDQAKRFIEWYEHWNARTEDFMRTEVEQRGNGK